MIKRIIAAVLINALAFGGIIHHAHAEFHELEKRKSLECLAMNIYFETRASSLADAMAVSDVVMNRVYSRHFPNNICDVIYQAERYESGQPKRNQCQFSWYCDGKSDKPTDTVTYDNLYELSLDILSTDYPYVDITDGATHYHADHIRPAWAATKTKTIEIEDHIFYRWEH